MSCPKFHDLLHGYLDGELDLAGNLEVENHLEQCKPCLAAYETHQAIRGAIRDGALYHQSPTELRQRVMTAIREESPAALPMRLQQKKQVRWWIGIAAAILIAASLIWQFIPRSQSNALAQELVSDHIRSLLAMHLMDVVSTDQHTVKPWFNGRLDFSPPVQNFAQEGFPLVGGRLDYANSRSVAALVYQHGKHYVNVFVWPASSEQKTKADSHTLNGYHVVQWRSGGMNFAAVSDMSAEELNRLVQLLQSAPTTTPADLKS